VLADTTDIRLIFVKTLAISFLLDLDDNMYSALFADSPDAKRFTTRLIGKKTESLCTDIKTATVLVLAVAQILSVILFKTQSTLFHLYAIPLVGVILVLCSVYYFPNSRTIITGLLLSFVIVFAVWGSSIFCLLVPVCEGRDYDMAPLFYPTGEDSPNPIVAYRQKHLDDTMLAEALFGS